MLGSHRKTCEILKRAVDYFWALFECTWEEVTLVDAYTALYEERLVHKAFTLDILSPEMTWTIKILDGFNHLLNFICMEAEDAKNDIALRYATTSRPRFVIPLRKKLFQEKEKRHQRRRNMNV